MCEVRFGRPNDPAATILMDKKMFAKEKKCKIRLGCCLSRGARCRRGGGSVRALALRLYEDKSSTFSRLVDGFVACARASGESDPHAAMRGVRQFVSGMKNHLREHAARHLFQKRAAADEEAEEVLQELVAAPLLDHLARLLEARLGASGRTARLSSGMAAARGRSPQDLGAGDHVPRPPRPALDALSRLLWRVRREHLPSGKLRCLVACVHALLIEMTSCSERRGGAMSGDDLLPMLVLLVAHSGMAAAELEAELMWGLLDRASLFSEGGYYLTSFSCAVQALQNLQSPD